MAFQDKKLGVASYNNGWTCWVYKDRSISVDKMMEVGYFDKVQDLMDIGDVIYLVAQDTAKKQWVKTLRPVSLEDLGNKI